MSHESGLQQAPSKLQSALGGRFLERTRKELSVMQNLLHQARGGDTAASDQLLLFVHRIGGAAAMLGFAQISEPVRNAERILRAGVLSSDDWYEIELHIQHLQLAVNEAGESFTP